MQSDQEQLIQVLTETIECLKQQNDHQQKLIILQNQQISELSQEILLCPVCKKEHDEFVTAAAEIPSPLMLHSPASPSTVAYIMYQKYANAMPLYRQEKDWLQIGVKLHRAIMAN